MGVSKTELFTERQNRIAALTKAIGHPARVAILEHLNDIDGCICGDLVEEIGLAQPTISQHLAVLKRAGLIRGTIKGTSKCYCIDPVGWNALQSLMADFFAQNTAFQDVCCD